MENQSKNFRKRFSSSAAENHLKSIEGEREREGGERGRKRERVKRKDTNDFPFVIAPLNDLLFVIVCFVIFIRCFGKNVSSFTVIRQIRF